MAASIAIAGALAMSAPAVGAIAKVAPFVDHPSGEGAPLWILRYSADPGEANRASVRFERGRSIAIVSDPGARLIRTGRGCFPLGLTTVLCDATVSTLPDSLGHGLVPLLGFRIVSVNLGDRDDVFRHLAGQGLEEIVDAGPGDDVVRSGGTIAEVLGGPGDDRLLGGSGFDGLTGGPGTDDVSGGPGASDLARYNDSSEPDAPRTVSLDDVANDGAPGEADNVHTDVESIFVAGATPDTLIGSDGPNTLSASNGDDVLRGLGGSDRLWASSGNDELDGGAGSDEFEASLGDDLLLAGDGEADLRLSCSVGFDRLVADLIDPSAFGCEVEDRG